MSTFVLVPGAGGMGWYWHRLVPELERLGHKAIAVDIREDDPRLGLQDYADTVVAAAGDHRDVVLVGQSLGAFTVPVVAARVPLELIVLLNPMVPLPGETPVSGGRPPASHRPWNSMTGGTGAAVNSTSACTFCTTFRRR